MSNFMDNNRQAIAADIEAFSNIPQPPRESFGFIEDLKKPLEYHFQPGRGIDTGEMNGILSDGVELIINFPETKDFPHTAFESLNRVLKAKNIPVEKETFPVQFLFDETLEHEEYKLNCSKEKITLSAADSDGLRRGIYFLEDKLCASEGASVPAGTWQRKPFVRHRISRCFFGPTNRPPFNIDELTNDVDYYPPEYLNKLAHEGINGLWLTMYMRDLPSSIFPNRGKDAQKRFAKLRKTVERCGRYGIKIYIFMSEPKLFGNAYYMVSKEDAKDHPELIGLDLGRVGFFCTSSETGKRYLQESVDLLFANVPGLGGLINIMMGEDNGSCVARMVQQENPDATHCPVCSKRDFADIYRELAELYANTIHKHNPEAEYIAWFYAPGQRDDSEFMQRLCHIAEKWPDCATLMFNFESGGTAMQLDKKRTVFDYSLAFVGPSKLFEESTRLAPKTGAKLQVGCSHENASVPFIPVPENLYDKYKFMHAHGVSAAMQCWYFGNYPGLMNKAAGELSFEPFPQTADEFLCTLAAPDWGKNAPTAAKAWNFFSQAYRNFPANLSFEWYGPLHHSIAWPYYLFPVDQPITPSWILNQFPRTSGDRFGECICFFHTLKEARTLCETMNNLWQQGASLLAPLKEEYADSPARLADIYLAEAIALQIKSTCNLLEFYDLREDMLFCKKDNLKRMKEIAGEEISNSRKMITLCEQDCRLGYHSEAEGYLFFPEKLKARIKLLEKMITEDFPRFDYNAPWVDEYTGKNPQGLVAESSSTSKDTRYPLGENRYWQTFNDGKTLYIDLLNTGDVNFQVILEPCRMWGTLTIDIRSNGDYYVSSRNFVDDPQVVVKRDNSDIHLQIPLHIFDGFRRPGFPMRFNIFGEKIHWSETKPWPGRLQHGDYNPHDAGWLIVK